MIGNIFIDSEGNIRLGDFGLATRNREKTISSDDEEDQMGSETMYNAIEDISHLLGGPSHSISQISSNVSGVSSNGDSLTGGVGTAFYIAPEQEATQKSRLKGDPLSYSTPADIFSFGVIMFEMFHPPFSTYMERAAVLAILRGDRNDGEKHTDSLGRKQSVHDKSFLEKATRRFPAHFVASVPENAQRLILTCVERDPLKRPKAEELLSSDLLPRKIELEQRYLQEALELLTNSQSEGYVQILSALFRKPTPDIVELTFDTDVAVKANNMIVNGHEKRFISPPDALMKAVGEIRAGAIDASSVRSIAMSSSPLVAATAALHRAWITGRLGKGGKGMLKRSTQRSAGILAMRAATAAAITGSLDGIHGADPTIVESVCEHIKNVFHIHGAVHLRSPLLRPRSNVEPQLANIGGPAELLHERGTVVLLPEDLTASLARAIGRGGAATSHIKRYDIDRVYHKALAGGHPRESLEASFDIVYEDHSKVRQLEAETIMVCSEVMNILRNKKALTNAPFDGSPLWYLRLNNTRLTDAILDLCGLPSKEAVRRSCLHILTRFVAPPPSKLQHFLLEKPKNTKQQKMRQSSRTEDLSIALAEAETQWGLPSSALEKFRVFIESCLPMSADIYESIEAIKRAITKLRTLEDSQLASKREKRFEDAVKSLRTVQELVSLLYTTMPPLVTPKKVTQSALFNRPLYISLDLGLRQRRKHYHGGMIYQGIVLPCNYFDATPEIFEDNESIVSPSGRGVKVAEGGDFSDLVRKYRPPGNFATTVLSYYTTAPIPMCAGIRIAVGKLIELIYLDASLANHTSQDVINSIEIDNAGLEILRQSLGHPLQFCTPVQCIVASVNGLDSASARDRFFVASWLWAEGISAEYLPHSGVMLSLVKRMDYTDDSGASDWSLVELFGVCALLKVPFVVIVQPHLLKEKNSVRVRRINVESLTQTSGSGNEMVVTLDSLAIAIRDGETIEEPIETAASTATQISRDNRAHKMSQVDCILIENDAYYGIDREISKNDTPHWKSAMKAMKKIEMASEVYLSTINNPSRQPVVGMQGIPVFAVDISFWAVRDFGTALMRRERQDQSALGAFNEIADVYPKYKRSLKTLSVAVDAYMKKHGVWSGRESRRQDSKASSLLTLLLYSRMDDRFDVISVNCNDYGGKTGHALAKRK